MCRNKRVIWILPFLAAAVCCQACAASDKLLADTGSSGKEEFSREEYLNVDALPGGAAQTPGGQYTVYTLAKGVFEEEALGQKLDREYANAITVYAELDNNVYTLEEYTAEYMDYVKKGDVVAVFHVTSNEIAIEEAEQKLQRLKMQCEQALQDRDKELLELEKERKKLLLEMEKEGLTENCYEVKSFDLRAGQKELTWEYEQQKREQEIADMQKKLDKLVGSGSILTIKAPTDGYVFYDNRYAEGSEMTNENFYICDILSGDAFYLKMERQGELFGYGMDMSFDVAGGDVSGKVVSAGDMALYGNLNTGTAVFLLDSGKDMPMGQQNGTIRGNLHTVSNVLLVPKQAVTEENGEYFVTVLKEDGSLLKTEFIPGGSNQEFYWVMNGLEEGMQIIYK